MLARLRRDTLSTLSLRYGITWAIRLFRPIPILSDDAKETVFFVGDSSGEKDSVADREKIAEPIKLEWRSMGAGINELP